MKKKKTTITLDNGEVVDCGLKEYKQLQQAIKKENPKQISLASIKLMQSSDKMMKNLCEGLSEIIDEFKKKKKDARKKQ